MGNKVTTLDKVAINDLIDLGLRMPDGSTELFEVVNKREDHVSVMAKNIIDFMPFNAGGNKHSGNANSYVESSIRSYLVGLYQSVAKENKLLEAHTFGHKEFFLPTTNALGLGAGKGWEAFKDDASRVKYPGTFAATKDEAYGPGEADWYWTSTPSATNADGVRAVHIDGALSSDDAYYGSIGAAPALNLKSSAPVILIDGVWHLHDSDTPSEDNKPKAVKPYDPVKAGDAIEVTKVEEVDFEYRISVGDVFFVEEVLSDKGVSIKLESGKEWWLGPGQFKRAEAEPKAVNAERVASDHYHDGNNGNDVWQFASDNFSGDRVKGFHQVNAIKYISRYHKKHQSKEKQLEDLRKAIGEIKELIRLEGGDV